MRAYEGYARTALGTALGLMIVTPASAQTAASDTSPGISASNGPGQEVTAQSSAQTGSQGGDIIVTAQRRSQRLQDVPIAVSAFTAENLERQQIVNPTALQQTLPNVTFTKTNFDTSSFTIRGVGDLCVGVTCDSATAIHVNEMPLLRTRLFESEFFDLERVEVLRGPQGTLFGRNATSGVVDFISAKPDLSAIHAAGEFEYGNYDSKRVKAMLNLPLTDTLGVRLAGTYLKRGGYTKNLFDGSSIDDRDLYALRGTLSWQPTSDTRVDLIGYYFHEKDNRSRIQKQLCHRDPTGVLGCLPDSLAAESVNANATLSTVLASTEFLRIATGSAANPAGLSAFALGSVYGTDTLAGTVVPTDLRTVNLDHIPTYAADEEQYTLKVFHNFGPVSLNVTAGYARNSVDSTTDLTLSVENPLINNPGLLALDAAGRAGGAAPFLDNLRRFLIPNGANGGLCQSAPGPNGVGVFGGESLGCFAQNVETDRSPSHTRTISAEAHIDSSFDGPFNFLLGGIYFDAKLNDVDYYVSGFGLDYASGLLGSATTAAQGGTSFLATPFYHNSNPEFRLKSYGIFGETYIDLGKLKVTLGLRYNNDAKSIRARQTFLNVPVPFGSTTAQPQLDSGTVDFDPSRAGNQPFADDQVSFSRLTGRAVVDYKLTQHNLLYASYSRGYKSGGINPPLLSVFSVAKSFAPESIDAFEMGSKNTFDGGRLSFNLTAFYYKYKDLQLSRIIARTAVNDNVNANIYGVEAEAIISPIPALVANLQFSYLKSRVSDDKFLANPRDPSGGRSDAVIIKDLTNVSNCAVVPNTPGDVTGVNGFVAAVNSTLGLRAPNPVPGTNATGAFSICSALAAVAADPPAGLRTAFGATTGALPFSVLGSGVETNIRGHSLPNAPTYKASAGLQYTANVGSTGYSIVPRVDINYTGGTTGTIFNLGIDRLQGYEIVNAQIQLNAPAERFYVRAFVQNLTANNAITGLYINDQSVGVPTNVFTVEPRRYGLIAGFKL